MLALWVTGCAPPPPPAPAVTPRIGCVDVGCDEALADLALAPHASALAGRGPFLRPVGPPTHVVRDAYHAEGWAAVEVDAIALPRLGSGQHVTLGLVAPMALIDVPRMNSPVEGSYPALLDNVRALGARTGRASEAAAAIARFDRVLAALRARATPATRATRVLMLVGADGYWPLPREGAFCQVLADTGLGACVGRADVIREESAEWALAADADWIVHLGDLAARDDPVWPRLRAVREGRVYAEPNPRHYWCCSARALIPALQSYVHHVIDPTVPPPGPLADFDPDQSPLAAPRTPP